MTATIPLRETRELLLQRARDAMALAEAETFPVRARIHLAAAERWIELADRKLKGDIRRGGGSAGQDDTAVKAGANLLSARSSGVTGNTTRLR
jgi:hypothetical protein